MRCEENKGKSVRSFNFGPKWLVEKRNELRLSTTGCLPISLPTVVGAVINYQHYQKVLHFSKKNSSRSSCNARAPVSFPLPPPLRIRLTPTASSFFLCLVWFRGPPPSPPHLSIQTGGQEGQGKSTFSCTRRRPPSHRRGGGEKLSGSKIKRREFCLRNERLLVQWNIDIP